MTAPCKHQHGAWVDDIALWICGQCFVKLAERPRTYRMAQLGGIPGSSPAPRQEIVWQAEIRISADGTTLAAFLRTIAKHLVRKSRGGLTLAEAYDIAVGILDAMGEEFGDLSADWSHGSARDLAVEEMTCWEQDGGNE